MTLLKTLADELLPPLARRKLSELRRGLTGRRTTPINPFTLRSVEDGTYDFVGAGRFSVRSESAADAGVIRQVFLDREYSLEGYPHDARVQAFERRLARPLIVDCGAHIGAATVWFSTSFPRAQVLAIEPDAENFALLQRNTAGRPLVRAVRGAIAGERGERFLVDPGRGDWGYMTQRTPARGAVPVPAITLRELVESAPEATPFLLKVDIEGGEHELFAQDAELFARFPVIVIELHDWMLPTAASSQPFLRWHAARNRDLVQRGENLFSISNEA